MARSRDRLKDAVARLVQLGSLYIALFHIGPFLGENAAWLGPIGAEVVSLITVALLTEFVIALFVSRPQIILTWHDGTNPNPLTQLLVDSSSLNGERARYDLSIEARGGSSLGRAAFWWARRQSLRMRVEFPTAPVYMIVDLSTPVRESGKTVAEVAGSWGVEARLDTKPTLPTWAWARLLLQPVPPIDYVTNRSFPLQISLAASTRFGTMCARVVKTRPTASTLVLYK